MPTATQSDRVSEDVLSDGDSVQSPFRCTKITPHQLSENIMP